MTDNVYTDVDENGQTLAENIGRTDEDITDLITLSNLLDLPELPTMPGKYLVIDENGDTGTLPLDERGFFTDDAGISKPKSWNFILRFGTAVFVLAVLQGE